MFKSCDPMGCSSPGSSVHGISQAIIQPCVAISFSRGSSRHRIESGSPGFFTDRATREVHCKDWWAHMKNLEIIAHCLVQQRSHHSLTFSPVSTLQDVYQHVPRKWPSWWLQMLCGSVQLLSCVQLCNPMNHSTLGFPVHHQLLELAQTNVHWVGDAIQPSHPLLSPSPLTFSLSQH